MEKEKGGMKLLHRNNLGCIKQCNCCTEIHLLMGNILFHVDGEEFNSFKQGFDQIREPMLEEFYTMGPRQKLFLETKDVHLKIGLNREEMLLLFELLDIAALLIEIQNILLD